MEKEIVTLHGAFHGRNFGDLLLLQLQLSWLAGVGFEEVCVPKIKEDALKLINIPDGMKVNDCCSSMIIFGGGGYFGAPSRSRAKWIVSWVWHHALVLAKAALPRTKVFLVGTEVGPLPPFPFSFLLKLAVRQAIVICPRNEESASYLRQLVGPAAKITVGTGTDIAVWLAGNAKSSFERDNDVETLGIHLAQPLDDMGRFEEFLDALGAELSTHGFRLRILVDQKSTNGARRQRECGEKVAKASGLAYEIVTFETVNQFVNAIAECHRLITSKLHVGIVGRCYGVRVLSIPTHAKTIRFYKQIGEAAHCKPWGRHELPDLVEEIGTFLVDAVSQPPLSDEVLQRGNGMRSIFDGIASQ